MKKNEHGMTLVEVLATLLLISLVTGIIWTTISVATQFNIGETTSLKLQQEANYIIAELQRVHRMCETYKVTISKEQVSINDCEAMKGGTGAVVNDEIISDGYRYIAIIDKEEIVEKVPGKMMEGEDFVEYINYVVRPLKEDLRITYFAIIDLKNDKRYVNIPTTISRYKLN
ncbi:hypothetical protein SporoP37_02200 [Sporosarcina sp. P37]|uniref:type II secretion system protein n=1 Tax=unclassified Sporosarcina TaxID=2647733 RepID=UPI000A17F64E|nr:MULTISPECIES: type II secretion system protein [unclassified Sporosarcina]ARK23618.1 hypothetical protein SporoP37_02200 [Sporosarcina sp. P37]PID18759.1 type II secretion system protein [Sporosarcina sp. P35]